MGTWGIALDMAKRNEENLSKLSRKGVYKKIVTKGSNGKKKKIYRFKTASAEQLQAIRKWKIEDNIKLRNKKIALAFAIVITLVSITIYFA